MTTSLSDNVYLRNEFEPFPNTLVRFIYFSLHQLVLRLRHKKSLDLHATVAIFSNVYY